MPVEGINGILNVESAALHAPQVGVANTNPQHILSVGSNLYVSGDSPDVLTVDGNVVCEGVKVGLIEIIPSYDLAAVSNVGNTTSNTIQFTNPGTGIVTTGNVSVGKDLNVTGNLNVLGTTTTIDTDNLRVQDPIIELGKDNAGTGDLGLIMTRPSGSSNVAVIFDENTDTLKLGYTNGGASDTTITMDSAPLSVNVNGNLSVTSNVEVGTANLFVDTTNSRVGVGTSIPTESLDVVGNMNLQQVSNTASIKLNSNVVTEFPRSKKFMKFPRLLLTYAAQSSQGGYENYVVNQSSVYSSESSSGAYLAFRGNSHWLSSSNSFDGGDDVFNGTNGPWISIQLPTKIKLEYLEFSASSGRLNQLITAGSVYASNDGSTWINIGSLDNLGTYTNVVPAHVDFTHTTLYDRYLLHITANQTNYVHMEKLSLFGVPEYDPEAHGTDVVVKSVPNVPNTDWLEVYYDGQDYTQTSDFTGTGGVIDKAGGDQDGTASSGVSFDSTYKAFNFDGTANGKIVGTHNFGTDTSPVLTMSFWMKRTAVRGNYDYIATIGTSTTGQMIGLTTNPSNQFNFGNYGDGVITAEPILLNQWYHVTLVTNGEAAFNSTNFKMYINGKEPVLSGHGGNSTTTLTGTQLTLGTNTNSAEAFNGSIANFRLFNRALTSDEIWQLYAYQNEYFGHGVLGMTLKAGRLGIGTSEPRVALDVRGSVLINGQLFGSGSMSGGNDIFDIDGYRVHVFTTSGNLWVLSNDLNVDVLLVAGGGGGGQDNAGGGGAGGLIFKPGHRLQVGGYNVIIGSGGSGCIHQNDGPEAKVGGNTEIKRLSNGSGDLVAYGGGAGMNGGNERAAERNGGSGGGGASESTAPTGGGTATQTGTYNYGNNGGDAASDAGGGGGGAGLAGQDGSTDGTGYGGIGGDGLNGVTGYDFAEIFGTRHGELIGEDVWFAGGGAGGNINYSVDSTAGGSFRRGGKGGGGGGPILSNRSVEVTSGLPNTGGGGTGATWFDSSPYAFNYDLHGGDGGSGIVMIRYKL